jgi:BMFP domain-containing protein YqiC
MADDETNVEEAPELETPSTEGAPEGEESEETTSEETEGEADPPDESSDEGEAAEGDDDDDDAWKNLTKKFDHIKSPRDRKAAIGRAYWEKTRYASQTRKDLEETKARLAVLEAKPKADEPPAAPHPDVAKLDQRIQGLVQKDNTLVQNQQELLGALRGVDEEIVKWKTKAEDADEYNKALYEQKSETAAVKKATLLQRWADINDRREQLSYDVDRLMSDRNWVQQFVQQEEQRKASEVESAAEFNQTFPRFVDETIEEIATELGAPKATGIREDLRSTVRDKMTVALWKLSKQNVDEVDVPEMVRGYVQGYLKRNDLVGRTKFTEKSKNKLAVSSKASAPKPGTQASKPSPGKPVRLGQMTQSELSPAMSRARSYLQSRGL